MGRQSALKHSGIKPPVFSDPVYMDKTTDAALCMKWSPVGMYLALGIASGDLVLYKYQKDRTLLLSTQEAHQNGIQTLEWAQPVCCTDGEIIIASGGQDGKIRVWLIDSGANETPKITCKQTIECGNRSSWIQSIVWIPSHPYHFAVACKKQILVCSAKNGSIVKVLSDASSSTINQLTVDTRLQKLVACSYGSVSLFDIDEKCDLASHSFDAQQLDEKGLMLTCNSTPYYNSPQDSSVIFAGMQDEIVMVWIVQRQRDSSKIKVIQKLKLRGFAGKVSEISLDQQQKRYIACSGSPVVIVWDSGEKQEDIENGCMDQIVCAGIREAVTSVKFRPYEESGSGDVSKRQNLVIASSRQGTIMAWDISEKPIENQRGTRMFIPNCAYQGTGEITALEWSRQGKVFAGTFVDGTIAIFECAH